MWDDTSTDIPTAQRTQDAERPQTRCHIFKIISEPLLYNCFSLRFTCQQRHIDHHRRSTCAYYVRWLQIYDAQFPERSCLALPESAPDWLQSHNVSAELDGAWPGGLSRRVMPETPKHKDLWPLDVWDVVGWLIGVVTLFIAAGMCTVAPPSWLYCDAGLAPCIHGVAPSDRVLGTHLLRALVLLALYRMGEGSRRASL